MKTKPGNFQNCSRKACQPIVFTNETDLYFQGLNPQKNIGEVWRKLATVSVERSRVTDIQAEICEQC